MQRVKEIDIEKSFGIILMIMGHQFYGDVFDKLIHGFHMPMFFIISGFLYKNKPDFFSSLKRKVQTLLVPYLFFAFFHLIVFGVIKGFSTSDELSVLPKCIYHIFVYNNEGLPICGAIWFLSALFFTELLYILLNKIGNKFFRWIGVGCSVLAGLCLSCYDVRLPLCMDVSLVGVGLFEIGRIFKDLYEKYIPSKKILWSLLLFMVGSFVIFINFNVNLRLANYGNPLLFFGGATTMTVALFFISSLFHNEGMVVKELIFIGQNSIVYLGLNQFVLIFLKKIKFDDEMQNFIYKLIALAVCLAVIHVFSFVLTKTKLKILIGK